MTKQTQYFSEKNACLVVCHYITIWLLCFVFWYNCKRHSGYNNSIVNMLYNCLDRFPNEDRLNLELGQSITKSWRKETETDSMILGFFSWIMQIEMTSHNNLLCVFIFDRDGTKRMAIYLFYCEMISIFKVTVIITMLDDNMFYKGTAWHRIFNIWPHPKIVSKKFKCRLLLNEFKAASH